MIHAATTAAIAAEIPRLVTSKAESMVRVWREVALRDSP